MAKQCHILIPLIILLISFVAIFIVLLKLIQYPDCSVTQTLCTGGFFTYPGSKNGNGVYQWLINKIPKHKFYIEGFAGSAVIANRIYNGQKIVLIEKSLATYSKLKSSVPDPIAVFNCDFFDVIDGVLSMIDDSSIFLYLDPPYPFSSRRSTKDLYQEEMSDQDHEDLLRYATLSPFKIMISTRRNDLYSSHLSDWHRDEFLTSDRGGTVKEVVYTNYDPCSIDLHTYEYLGKDFTDRQRIKRIRTNLVDKLNRIGKDNPQLKAAILQDIKTLEI